MIQNQLSGLVCKYLKKKKYKTRLKQVGFFVEKKFLKKFKKNLVE